MSNRDAAFAEYFAARSAAMRGSAYLLCGDWHRAEDLVQTAFTKLYLAWNRVSRHDVLDAYVRRIIVRTFLNERRRGWWRRERVDAEPSDRPVPAESPEIRLVLLNALATVPPRRARFRRTAWACAGSAVAVLAVGGVAAASLPAIDTWTNGDGYRPAAGGTHSPKDQLKYARRQPARLVDEIVSVVPAGYTAPEDPQDRPVDQMPMRSHAAGGKNVNGVPVWTYQSSVAVARGERMGWLLVEVDTPGQRPLTGESCELAQQFGRGTGGECQVMTVGTAQVGVVVRPTSRRDERLDQWAAYRYPDGTAVFVGQALNIPRNSQPPLATLPFSPQQLAALAVNKRFHLD